MSNQKRLKLQLSFILVFLLGNIYFIGVSQVQAAPPQQNPTPTPEPTSSTSEPPYTEDEMSD